MYDLAFVVFSLFLGLRLAIRVSLSCLFWATSPERRKRPAIYRLWRRAGFVSVCCCFWHAWTASAVVGVWRAWFNSLFLGWISRGTPHSLLLTCVVSSADDAGLVSAGKLAALHSFSTHTRFQRRETPGPE